MAFSSAGKVLFSRHAHHLGAASILGLSVMSQWTPRQAQLEDQKHRTYATRGTLREFRRYYREGEKLGEGTFAVVKRGVDLSTKEAVAIKAIDKDKSDEECRANEVQVMEKMGKHPNLVGLHNIYEGDGQLLIIQDLAEGGELFERVVKSGELNEGEAAKLFKGAVSAVEHLHSRHIAQ
jgi:serine/threonine protein kinase